MPITKMTGLDRQRFFECNLHVYIFHFYLFKSFTSIPIDGTCIVKRNRRNADCFIVYVRPNRINEADRHFTNEMYV